MCAVDIGIVRARTLRRHVAARMLRTSRPSGELRIAPRSVGAGDRETRTRSRLAILTTERPREGGAPPARGPAVRLEGLVKRFGGEAGRRVRVARRRDAAATDDVVVAVDGVDLEIADGEFFSMLGPSGSGKTTTLRLIAGFELPTEGRVLAPRRRRHTTPPFERDVNTVFQDYALFPHMTVGDNVAYGLMVRRCPKAERERRVAEALRMVRLEGYERPQAVPALGRAAAARRAGAGARQPATRAAARRAARRARPQAPRGDADRAQGDPARGRDHVHLRDPRPGGGAHDERPPGRLQPRADRAGRRARRGLRAAGDAVRRRLRRHVQPAHAARPRGRSSARRARSRSGRRRSGSPTPRRRRRRRESARRHHPERRLSRSGHALHRRRSTPAPSSS